VSAREQRTSFADDDAIFCAVASRSLLPIVAQAPARLDLSAHAFALFVSMPKQARSQIEE
jgi:hypothetical protein